MRRAPANNAILRRSLLARRRGRGAGTLPSRCSSGHGARRTRGGTSDATFDFARRSRVGYAGGLGAGGRPIRYRRTPVSSLRKRPGRARPGRGRSADTTTDGTGDGAVDEADGTGTEVADDDTGDPGTEVVDDGTNDPGTEVVDDDTNDSDTEVVDDEADDSGSSTGAVHGNHRGSVSTLARAGLGSVFGKLRSQGYDDIAIEQRDGMIFVSGSRRDQTRHLVYDAATGALVSDVSEPSGGILEALASKLKQHGKAAGDAELGDAKGKAHGSRKDRSGKGHGGKDHGGKGGGHGKDGGGSKGGGHGKGGGSSKGGGQGNGKGGGKNK